MGIVDASRHELNNLVKIGANSTAHSLKIIVSIPIAPFDDRGESDYNANSTSLTVIGSKAKGTTGILKGKLFLRNVFT